MEAGQHGLTRVTCFLAFRLELDAVAWLLWLSWCVLGGAGFFPCFFYEFAFSNSYIQSSQRRLGEGAPTASQSPQRTRAHLSPPGVPFSVFPPEKYFEHGVISSSV